VHSAEAESGRRKEVRAETKGRGKSVGKGRKVHFRFEDLEIWQKGRDLAVCMHKLSQKLDEVRYYRYAEQLRAAALSVPNNIAEGSASPHVKEFGQFLNIARRSLFEDASMLLVFAAMGIWTSEDIDDVLERCDHLSRMITNYSRSLSK